MPAMRLKQIGQNARCNPMRSTRPETTVLLMTSSDLAEARLAPGAANTVWFQAIALTVGIEHLLQREIPSHVSRRAQGVPSQVPKRAWRGGEKRGGIEPLCELRGFGSAAGNARVPN